METNMSQQGADNPTQRHFQIGLLLAVVSTALFAFKAIFIKLAYLQGVDTVTLLTLRMLVSAPIYLGVLGWVLYNTTITQPSSREFASIMGLGFIGYYVASWMDMQSLHYISAQLARLTLYTYPIMTTLLGWLLLREAVTSRILLALALTYSGVLLLYAYESQQLGGNHISLGVALIAGAALVFSFYVVLSKRLIGKFGSLFFTSIVMLTATVCVSCHFVVTHPVSDLLVNSTAWLYAALLGIVSTVIPSFMLSEAISRIGAARTSIVGTFGPVVTILLSVILLDEAFSWPHLAGMLLVIFGVSLLGKK
jgi:drug/metabolite transporter (DMT)-like permease